MSRVSPIERRKGLLSMAALGGIILIAACVLKPVIPKGVKPFETTAVIVQANVALFHPGSGDEPVQVIFSLDPNVSNARLKDLARVLFELKGTRPSDHDKTLMAKAVADTTYRPYEFKRVPYSISGSEDVYIAHVVVERVKLSKGYLQEDSLLRFNLYLINGGKPDDGKPHAMEHVGEVRPH